MTDKNILTDRRAILSTLWIFLLFNIFFADFQWLITSGAIEEILSGTVRGYEMTASMLLFAAIVHEIPVLMIFLSRILKRIANRWLNISMGALNLFFVVSSGWTTPDQIFFKVFMTISMVLVIWYAWTWPKEVE